MKQISSQPLEQLMAAPRYWPSWMMSYTRQPNPKTGQEEKKAGKSDVDTKAFVDIGVTLVLLTSMYIQLTQITNLKITFGKLQDHLISIV
jgi:hypothetical protein